MASPAPNLPSTGQNPFSIGSLTFASVDGPQKLSIGGGKHEMSVIKLVGGGRVIHTTGFQAGRYDWSGSVYQPNVASVVTTLRAYSVDGIPRLMSWFNERYNGIVAEFVPEYRNGGNICDWKVSIEVTSDANGAFATTTGASIDSANQALLNSANQQFATIIGVSAPTDAQLQALVQQSQAAMIAANASIAMATPAVGATPGQLTGALQAIGIAVGLAQKLAGRFPSTSLGFVPAQGLASTLQLIAQNFLASQVQTVHTQQGGSLYALAATKYGDVTRAFDLMKANGISAPRLPGTVVSNIGLPPFPNIVQ